MGYELERALRACAGAACAMVVGMLAIYLVTGVGQDPLQFVRPPDEYALLLTKSPTALRACLAMDNLFIVFYSATFVALGAILHRAGAARLILFTAVGLLLFLALLDMAENFHFMVMLARAEAGIPPSSEEIAAQVWESLLKFHVSYLGLFLLGLALPRRTPAERALSNLSLFVQLPVGVLIYVTPQAVSVPLVFVRFAYFVTALILVAMIFGKPAALPTAVGSGAPA